MLLLLFLKYVGVLPTGIFMVLYFLGAHIPLGLIILY